MYNYELHINLSVRGPLSSYCPSRVVIQVTSYSKAATGVCEKNDRLDRYRYSAIRIPTRILRPKIAIALYSSIYRRSFCSQTLVSACRLVAPTALSALVVLVALRALAVLMVVSAFVVPNCTGVCEKKKSDAM